MVRTIGYYESIYADDLPSRAVTVYLYLQKRANSEHQCWPSIRRIAADLHLSRRTVERALRDLERNGWVKAEQRWRENGGKSSLLFTLL